MRIVLAPDKFNGPPSAAQMREHLAVGIRRPDPAAAVLNSPVADGGDGTLDAALQRLDPLCASSFGVGEPLSAVLDPQAVPQR